MKDTQKFEMYYQEMGTLSVGILNEEIAKMENIILDLVWHVQIYHVQSI